MLRRAHQRTKTRSPQKKVDAAREQFARWNKSEFEVQFIEEKLTLACLRPRCQRWSCFSNLAASDVETVKFLSLWRFGRRIRVTQENWAFFFSRKNHLSTDAHRAKSWNKSSKRLHQNRDLKSVRNLENKSSSRLHASSIFLVHVPLEIPIVDELAPSSYQSWLRWLWGGLGEALWRLGEAFGAS